MKSPVPAGCTSYAKDIGRLCLPRRTVQLGLARFDAPAPYRQTDGLAVSEHTRVGQFAGPRTANQPERTAGLYEQPGSHCPVLV